MAIKLTTLYFFIRLYIVFLLTPKRWAHFEIFPDVLDKARSSVIFSSSLRLNVLLLSSKTKKPKLRSSEEMFNSSDNSDSSFSFNSALNKVQSTCIMHIFIAEMLRITYIITKIEVKNARNLEKSVGAITKSAI
jgi:hypothetical protein